MSGVEFLFPTNQKDRITVYGHIVLLQCQGLANKPKRICGISLYAFKLRPRILRGRPENTSKGSR